MSGKKFKAIVLGLPTDIPAVAAALEIRQGELCRESGQAVMVKELADKLGVGVGDRLIYLARRGPRSANIVGLATGTSVARFVPGATLVMPLADVQMAFRLDGQVDRIRVLIATPADETRVRKDLAERLPPTLLVQTPVGRLELADSLLRSTELALNFAGLLSMAMAGFLVLNTLRMNFSERRAAMAVVRLLGGTWRQVFGLQMLEGAMLGLIGTLLGIPLGLLLGQGLTQGMQRLLGGEVAAAAPSPWPWIIAMLAGPLVALQAALIPAFQSRKVSPLEALGESELRGSDHIPRWSIVVGLVAWSAAVFMISQVVVERLSPNFALPAGLLMLVAFIMVIPALISPSVRAAGLLVSPSTRVEAFLASEQVLRRRTRMRTHRWDPRRCPQQRRGPR